ncbi:unnamed protein product [Malus baccata var. baccata]
MRFVWCTCDFNINFINTRGAILRATLVYNPDPTSPRGVDHVSRICILSSLPSTKPFGSSLASGSIGTLKLSEFVREQSHDG